MAENKWVTGVIPPISGSISGVTTLILLTTGRGPPCSERRHVFQTNEALRRSQLLNLNLAIIQEHPNELIPMN